MIGCTLALVLSGIQTGRAQEADTGWYADGDSPPMEPTATSTADERIECGLEEPPDGEPRIEWSVSDRGAPELVVISGDGIGDTYDVAYSMTFDGHLMTWGSSPAPGDGTSWTVPIEVPKTDWIATDEYYVQLRARVKIFGSDGSRRFVRSAGTVLFHIGADGELVDAITWTDAMARGGYDSNGALVSVNQGLVNAAGDAYILAGISPVHQLP